MFGALLSAADVAGAEESGEVAYQPTPTDIEQAAEQFNLGRSAFKTEDYVAAAEHFERADALAPNPKVLMLAIQSRHLAEQSGRSATLAALASQRHPGDPIFEDAQPILRRALEELGKLRVICDEPCTVVVDSRLMHGRAATKRFIFLEPGKYRVRAYWGDELNAEREFAARAGEGATLRFSKPSGMTVDSTEPDDWGDEPADDDFGASSGPFTYDDPPDPPQLDTAAAGMSPAVFWTGVGLTAALAGVTVWSGVDTANNPGADRVEAQCAPGNSRQACQELLSEGLDKQSRTNLLIGATAGVGVLTLLIGTIWTDWDGQSSEVEPSSAHLELRPWFGVVGGPAVGAMGRF